MKGSLAAFDEIAGRSAAARIVGGSLDDFLIDPPDDRIRPGAIYRARVGRPMKGQGGAILETPDGPLFLRQAKGVAQGDSLIVQTSTYAERGKATPVSPRLLLKSRFCMITPGAIGRNISKAIRDEERRVELREILDTCDADETLGIVLRTAASDADDTAIADDLAATVALARSIASEPMTGAPEILLDGPSAAEIAWREWPVPDVTDADPGSFSRTGVDDMIDAILSPMVTMSDGGSIFIEQTRALVAVDVNTGGDTSPAAGLKANLSALKALPRALRLRGLGGQIVVDMAPTAKRDRRRVEDAARAAFRADGIETTVVGWTPLGHLELIRKRERLPISESLR